MTYCRTTTCGVHIDHPEKRLEINLQIQEINGLCVLPPKRGIAGGYDHHHHFLCAPPLKKTHIHEINRVSRPTGA
jgi:hypothetical protein